MSALRVVAIAPIRFYQRAISPALPWRCKYYPSCSRVRRQAVRRYGILRGLVLAAWRLLRCNPWSHGGVDPVEDQTLFRSRSRAAALAMYYANILQPLIDVCEAILEFWHDLIGGLSWGWSIILLTVHRPAGDPAADLQGVKSMQRLQQLQPEIKQIQARYKDDKQRQHQEMMELLPGRRSTRLPRACRCCSRSRSSSRSSTLLRSTGVPRGHRGQPRLPPIPNLGQKVTGDAGAARWR